MKKELLVLVAIIFAINFSSKAEDFSAVNSDGDTIYYNITSSTLPLTVSVTFKGNHNYDYYYEYTGSVSIPDSVLYSGNYYKVTSIGADAFETCTALNSITIPNSVISIGDYAFDFCIGLTSVTIGTSVTSIGNNAFEDCTGLTSVTIPNSVISIGNNAFEDCTGLTTLTIGNSVTTIGDNAFINNTSLNTVYFNPINCITMGTGVLTNPVFEDCNNLSVVIVGNTVQNIPKNAFYGCSGLSSLIIPNSVVSIGNAAFNGCSGLTSLTIGNSVTSIGNNAFNGCTGLISLTIGNSVDSIGEGAFGNCNGLNSITIPNSVTSIGDYAFRGCGGITSITIPKYVTSIGRYAFANNGSLNTVYFNPINCIFMGSDAQPVFTGSNNLSTIIIGDSVQSIPDYAFYNCISLTSISFPPSVTSLGDYSFKNCNSLSSITIPSTITHVGGCAFSQNHSLNTVYFNSINCVTMGSYTEPVFLYSDSLSTIIIGDSVRNIPNSAFKMCRGLTSITIPKSIVSIGESAFYNDTSLTTVYFNPINCINMGRSTFGPIFQNCNNLSTIIIGDSVQNIPNYAFYNCGTLTSIIFGNSVDSIGNYSFKNCTGLNSLIIPNSVISIGKEAFYNCSGLNSISFSNSLASINEKTFQNCSGLTSISIPNSITSIGNRAFMNCTAISSLTIGNSVSTIDSSAFKNNTSLDTVYFNAINCMSMAYDDFYNLVFKDCSNLSVIIFGDSVQTVPNNAFYNCSTLTSIIIGKSVDSIGDYAFFGCNSLNSITSKAINPPAIQALCMYGMSTTIPVYVPCNSITSYQSAPYWSNFTNYIGLYNLVAIDTSISQGDTFVYNGTNFDTAGVYIFFDGCDSVVLTLNVYAIPIIPYNINIVENNNQFELTWDGDGETYEIYRDGVLFASVTLPNCIDSNIVQGQNYCYKIKALNKVNESEFSETICKTYLGIENMERTNISTKLYPNPTEGKAKLEIDGLTADADVLVYDIMGRVIQKHKINQETNVLDIDLSGYSMGVYSIRIVNESINQTRKLVVNK